MTAGALSSALAQAAPAWREEARTLAALPPRPERDPAQQARAESALAAARRSREAFLERCLEDLYDHLTAGMTRPLRARALVYEAAREFPGLVPSETEVAAERALPQAHKDGREIDQGILLAHVLAHPVAGRHLMHAMQRPLPEAERRLPEFQAAGRIDLGAWTLERSGRTGILTNRHTRYLNAEDDESNARLEVAVDLLLLDPGIEVGVLRGGPVDHPKHVGRRVFSSGLNLTALYHGQISLVDFMVERELGLNNKMFRGHSPSEFGRAAREEGLEKPFLAAVEGWAIGGGCQWLLVMDHVVAARDAYFNLPARKEGIIPGSANLRLWRLTGDRLARQAIFFNRDFQADGPLGALICDRVVEPAAMDAAIEAACGELTSAGRTSVVANRRMLRLAQETLDQHREYMSAYAREQAYCLYSPGLITNLEQHWKARERRLKAPASG